MKATDDDRALECVRVNLIKSTMWWTLGSQSGHEISGSGPAADLNLKFSAD